MNRKEDELKKNPLIFENFIGKQQILFEGIKCYIWIENKETNKLELQYITKEKF